MDGLTLSSLIINHRLKQSQKELHSDRGNAASEGKTPATSATPVGLTTQPETLTQHPAFVLSPSLATILPSLQVLLRELSSDLQRNYHLILTLNPSLRSALLGHLLTVAGQPSTTEQDPKLSKISLQKWIMGPHTPGQREALVQFAEEVALLYLCKAVLLKAWSDKGIRKMDYKDFVNINWALIDLLKPTLPLDREGWELTKLSIYSWYRPSEEVRQKIWNMLGVMNLSSENPDFIPTLVHYCLPLSKGRSLGYDSRFFKILFENLSTLGLSLERDDPGEDLLTGKEGSLGCHLRNYKRKKWVFSPTLKDGSLVPEFQGEWIGTESNLYALQVAEMVFLWNGPVAPPLWTCDNGFGVHKKEQLTLHWSHNPKPSIRSRIAEIENCDLAVVIEDKTVRPQGRSLESAQYRQELETAVDLKELKDRSTSRGCLQASVALKKLRPQGILVWARQEPLSETEGEGLLRFLLDHARLVGEWDFSGVQLPQVANALPLPNHVYIFVREIDVQKRSLHHPVKVKVSGQPKSLVEIPYLAADAFQAHRSEVPSRGHWKLERLKSIQPQSEWMNRWPDPSTEVLQRKLEKLKEHSRPLGQVAIIRSIPYAQFAKSKKHWPEVLSPHLPAGILLDSNRCGDSFRLNARPIRHSVGCDDRSLQQCRLKAEFLVVLSKPHWAPVISAYLQSSMVHEWLDFYCEKNKSGIVLKEQVLKFIPIPLVLLQSLEKFSNRQDPEWARPEWTRMTNEVRDRPALLAQTLKSIPIDSRTAPMRANIFVRTAEELENLRSQNQQLFEMVSTTGQLRWRALLSVLPVKECTSFSIHPQVRLNGSLPAHHPIHRMELLTGADPGILLANESGQHMRIGFSHPVLLEMTWDQIREHEHPTWAELTSMVFIPRNVDMGQNMAGEILKKYGDKTKKLQDLLQLLEACTTFV